MFRYKSLFFFFNFQHLIEGVVGMENHNVKYLAEDSKVHTAFIVLIYFFMFDNFYMDYLV